MANQKTTITVLNRDPTRVALYAAIILTSTTAMVLSGCVAAAAAAGAGYAVGHEQGEDHVTSGEHGDDD